MNRKNNQYQEPEPIHEFLCSASELRPDEVVQVLDAILDHLGLYLYRTNRNKHSELRIEVRERD